jgi:microcystin-dependent protein
MADISVDPFTWSSTAASNSPSGGTSVGTGLDDNLRAMQAAMKAFIEPLSSVAGTNTITATFAGLTAYASGQSFGFTPAETNTGAATINITALGAKNIFLNGAALVGYEMRKNQPVRLFYDGTQFNIISGAHGDGTPLGTVLPHAPATAPSGFLLCYGQAVSRTTYADLFGLLSTTYGTGDGSTTFNVPDLRGRVAAGQDDMGGSSANRLTNQSGGLNGDTLGATGGAETHTLSGAESGTAAHSHTASGSWSYREIGGGGSTNFMPNTDDAPNTSMSVSVTVNNASAAAASSAHNNVQPTIILNYIIKF